MSGCARSVHVERHFGGTISPSAERAMREHMSACASCQDLYRRHLLLSRLDPTALTPEDRIARGLGFGSRGAPRMVGALGLAGVAAAAAILLVLGADWRTDGFSARGRVVAPVERASRIFVYEIGLDGRPLPAGDSLKRGDELAFAYENGAGRRRLAIFGVDEHHRVYWFFPAWTREADDPVAIPITTDSRRHELPEAIRQTFEGTHLEIRSLFLDDPLSVRQIESLLEHGGDGPLPLPGAVERSLSLVVKP
jgi:hypothetical protein